MSPVVNLGSMCVHFMCACVDTGLLLYWILRFLKDCIQFVKWNPAHIDDDLMHFEETMPVWGPASSGFWDQSCFHPLSISSLWIWGPGLPSGLLEALHQTVFLPLRPSSGIRDKREPVEIQVKLLQILPGTWSGESPFLVLCLEQSAFAQSKSFSVWLEEAIGARPVLRLPHTQQVWAFTCLLKGLTEHHHGGRNPALQPREWKGCSDLGHP